MTIYEIAGKAHITHPTARKYVQALYNDGLLYKVIKDNGDVGYIFNYELFKKLKEDKIE
jgi:predicted DNA-binding transcriptional regulator